MPMKEFRTANGELIETRMMTKSEVLEEAIIHREDEVMQYQINIDNYVLMIDELEAIPQAERSNDQNAFLQEIKARVEDEKREQSKAQLVLNALVKNLQRDSER